MQQRCGDVVFIVQHRHHADGVQRIIEEVGIDLTLEHLIFRDRFPFFRFGHGVDQLVDLLHQPVEPIIQVAEFVVAPFRNAGV